MRLFVVLPLLAAACIEQPPGITVFEERFETCTVPCGWRVFGTASLVSTFHPGQHAMFLGPRTVIQRGVTIQRGGWTNDDGSSVDDERWIEYTSTCPGAPHLTLGPGMDADAIDLVVRLPDGAPGGDFARTRSSLPLFRDPPTEPQVRIPIGLVRVTTETGCIIDNLRVAASAPEYGL